MAEFEEQWNKGTFPGWMVIVICIFVYEIC